jgi:hypothetical protein
MLSTPSAGALCRPRLRKKARSSVRVRIDALDTRLIFSPMRSSPRFCLGTVRDYVQHVIMKLEVPDRTQAAVKAVRLGLVEAAGSGSLT